MLCMQESEMEPNRIRSFDARPDPTQSLSVLKNSGSKKSAVFVYVYTPYKLQGYFQAGTSPKISELRPKDLVQLLDF